MLHQPTIEKLLAMRVEPMVEAWRTFGQDENTQTLAFEEKLALMVDRLWTWRQNLALERRLRYAKLRGNACVEDVDYRAARGLDRNVLRSLAHPDPAGGTHAAGNAGQHEHRVAHRWRCVSGFSGTGAVPALAARPSRGPR